ncbi:MAG: hypothetical protein HGA96_10935 [Desulfobulbaceae bacterium]|nr:hypothetical protein [Desulfobulbaceae bacterium]
MEIFCQKCQKQVGKIADEKIPVGQKASVKCPSCSEKIILFRPAPAVAPDISGNPGEKPASGASQQPGTAIPDWQESVKKASPPPAARATGEYDFTIGAVLKEAWQKTSGVKGPLWGAGSMVFLVMTLAIIAMALVVRTLDLETGGIALSAALQITFTVALYPFLAGVMMIGIRRSVDLPVNWKMAFGYFSYLLPVVIASFLLTIMTFLGFLLLLIPGIYLSLGYMLTIPLIVEKGMGPWQAMEASRKAIHQHWFKIFGLYLTMGIIYILSMIPLFLGVIWTLPMFVMVGGILYREIFGVSEKS